jgi:hypothetical protein
MKADWELAAISGGNYKRNRVTSAHTFSFDRDPFHVDPDSFAFV